MPGAIAETAPIGKDAVPGRGVGLAEGAVAPAEDAAGDRLVERFAVPPYRDARFYQKRKKGAWRMVEAPRLGVPVADTHAHVHLLPDPGFELARCAAVGVSFVCMIVDPSEDGLRPFRCLDDWCAQAARTAPQLEGAVPPDARFVAECHRGTGPDSQGVSAEAFPLSVRIAVGVHPHNARWYDDAQERQLRALLAHPRVGALGEVGLDYHYDLSPRDVQREAFRRQLRLAHEACLPVVLHVRDAHDDAFRILCEEGFPLAGTLLHCCSLPWGQLERWVQRDCFVAYGGALTFRKSDEARDAAARVPEGRLLTETDAPYMAPEPLRGGTCTPSQVLFTAARLAEVRGALSDIDRRRLLHDRYLGAVRLLDRPLTPWQCDHAAEAVALMAASEERCARIESGPASGEAAPETRFADDCVCDVPAPAPAPRAVADHPNER
ncbi:TatD family hydrolase [Berryella wangjianweii]|uniref:TatD family hydrolase n=1 Tax=Berryella wangjianweii TaxID=2734634 RepID=UPI0021BD3442|nr:TatD family hydrolase [Berryella wangjianweii]